MTNQTNNTISPVNKTSSLNLSASPSDNSNECTWIDISTRDGTLTEPSSNAPNFVNSRGTLDGTDTASAVPSLSEICAINTHVYSRSYKAKRAQFETLSKPDSVKLGNMSVVESPTSAFKLENVLVREDLHKYCLAASRGLYTNSGIGVSGSLCFVHIGSFIRIPLHPTQFLPLVEQDSTLYKSAKALVRISGPVYSMAKIIDTFSSREFNVLVQLMQGQCYLVPAKDVIPISSTFEEKLKRLPIVGAERLCIQRMQHVLLTGNTLELILGFAFFALSRSADYSQKDDSILFLIQQVSAALTVVLTLFSFYFVIWLPRSFETRTQANLTVKALLLCFVDLVNLLYPSPARLTVAVLSILVRFFQFTFILLAPISQTIWAQQRAENESIFKFLCSNAVYQYSQNEASESLDVDFMKAQEEAVLWYKKKGSWFWKNLAAIFREGFNFYLPETLAKAQKTAKLAKEYVVLDGKRHLQRLNRISPVYFAAIGIGLVLFVLTFMGLEFYRLITNQNTAITISDLNYMRNVLVASNISTSSSWTVNNASQSSLVGLGVGNPISSGNTPKVFFVLMDGLRYDHLTLNPQMSSVLQNASYAADAILLPMAVQTPTMSVPNWATFLTGAPPWFTGIIGNAATSLLSVDSVFSIAATYNKTTGMSASSWFSDLVQSYLKLNGGSVSTNDASFSYEVADMSNSAVADQQRLEAITGNLGGFKTPQQYDFFLAHFSDIDERGHASGVSQKYNKGNTYFNAVSDKARALNKILELVDNNTIVMMVADHGQVDSGGHGGAGDVLKHTFLWLYQKGSGLAAAYPQVKGWDTPANVRSPVNSVDIAGTVLSVLGLPVPMTSLGNLIPEVLSLIQPNNAVQAANNSAAQQLLLKHAYYNRVYSRARFPVKNLDSTIDISNLRGWQGQAATLPSVNEMQTTLHNSSVTGNVIVTIGYAIFAQFVLWVFLCYVTGIGRPTFINTKDRWEMQAVLVGFGSVFLYLLLAFTVFESYWAISGKNMWDSTLIHHPNTIVANVCVFWIPGVFLEVVIQFFMNTFCEIKFEAEKKRQELPLSGASKQRLAPDSLKLSVKNQLCVWKRRLWYSRKTQLHMQKCAKITLYGFYFISLFFLVSLICVASFSGFLKFQVTTMYLAQSDWVFRFRIMSLMWMGLPCIVGKLVSLIGILRSLSHLPIYHLKN